MNHYQEFLHDRNTSTQSRLAILAPRRNIVIRKAA